MSDILKIVLGGVVGAVIGPILLETFRRWDHERRWAKPRKTLLKTILAGSELPYSSIDRLSRTIGASHDETRTLLIELEARGARLKTGREGWALISRAPLKEADAADDDGDE